MKLKFKDTQFNITLKPTNNNIGLKENDYWYLTTISINNKEYKCNITEEIFTNNEIENTIKILEQKEPKEISYITNYIKLDLLDNKLELTLIEPLSNNYKTYKVIFDEQEILELINILKTK